MSWRLARALDVLRQQINTAAPNRDKRSDGTIGDQAHARGYSEHNPNAAGIVRAIDITHDPAGGVDGDRLAADAIAELDQRGVKGYVIFRGRIRSTYVQRGVWRTYTGSNPHSGHVHISYITGYDNTARWDLPSCTQLVVNTAVPTVKAPPWPLPAGHYIFHDPRNLASWHDGWLDKGDQVGHDAIKAWQQRMRDRGWTITVDGFYGKDMERVVRQFQEEKGLSPDAILGPVTWSAAWESVVTK